MSLCDPVRTLHIPCKDGHQWGGQASSARPCRSCQRVETMDFGDCFSRARIEARDAYAFRFMLIK